MGEVPDFVEPHAVIEGHALLEQFVSHGDVLLVALVSLPLEEHHGCGNWELSIRLLDARGVGEAAQDESIEDPRRPRLVRRDVVSTSAHAPGTDGATAEVECSEKDCPGRCPDGDPRAKLGALDFGEHPL